MMKLLLATILTTTLASGLATAQEAGQTIDIQMVAVGYWHVLEIEWAGDEPLSGETSTFDGRCSVPSDYVARGHSEGLIFPIGPATNETVQCGQLVWGEDNEGQRVPRGRLTTDGVMTMHDDAGNVIMSGSFYADEIGFDPVMGVSLHIIHASIGSATAMPGLTFVEGTLSMTYVIPDIAATLTESMPVIGAGHGTASFVPDATD